MLLGDYVKEKRAELNISQRELAKKIETSNTFVSNLEKNSIDFPNPRLLHKISVELNLDYFYLMKLAGFLPNNIMKKESLVYKYEKRDEWIEQYDYIKLELNLKIFNSVFDAYVETKHKENVYLNVITNIMSAETLSNKIRLMALDLLIYSNQKDKVSLDIIYPLELIPDIEKDKYRSVNENISYIPLKINIEYK